MSASDASATSTAERMSSELAVSAANSSPAPSSCRRAALRCWSAPRGRSMVGTPRLSAPSTVPEPAWLMTKAEDWHPR